MVQVQLKLTDIQRLSTSTSPCIQDMGNASYWVDLSTGQTETFLATRDDCLIHLEQNYLLGQCGCLDGSLYVLTALTIAPVGQDVPARFLNYVFLV